MSTHASERHEQRPHLDLWLVAVVGLAAALVALGSWVLIDRFEGAGSDSAITVIDDFVASVNADDTDALAAVVTADAEFTDGTGAREWLLAWGGETFVQGWTMERVAPVAGNPHADPAFWQPAPLLAEAARNGRWPK